MNPDVGRHLPLLRQLDHVQGPTDRQNVIFRSAADPIRLVQEELSVAERRFGVLINSHDDGLDVLVTQARPVVSWPID